MARPACGASMPAHGAQGIVDAVANQIRELDYARRLPDGPSEGVRVRPARHHLPPGLDHVSSPIPVRKRSSPALKMALAYHAPAASLALPPNRTRARLSRREFRGHLCRRHRAQPRTSSGHCCRASITCRTPTTSPATPSPRPARTRRGIRRRAGASRHAARCLDDRRRDRRAGRGLDRRAASRRRAISKSLRAICDKHGILLIFDEVITGFGRLGAPFALAVFQRHARPRPDREGLSPTPPFRWAASRRRRSTRPSRQSPKRRSISSTATPIRATQCRAPLASPPSTLEEQGLLTRGAELPILGRRRPFAEGPAGMSLTQRNCDVSGRDRARADRGSVRPASPSRPSSGL